MTIASGQNYGNQSNTKYQKQCLQTNLKSKTKLLFCNKITKNEKRIKECKID